MRQALEAGCRSAKAVAARTAIQHLPPFTPAEVVDACGGFGECKMHGTSCGVHRGLINFARCETMHRLVDGGQARGERESRIGGKASLWLIRSRTNGVVKMIEICIYMYMYMFIYIYVFNSDKTS